MQPNSLEFRPAQEWRTLDFMAAEWKRAMRESHECELEEVIQAYVDVRVLFTFNVAWCHVLWWVSCRLYCNNLKYLWL